MNKSHFSNKSKRSLKNFDLDQFMNIDDMKSD